MGVSLALLALFLGFWLQQEYTNERTQLQKEVQRNVELAVREVEDSLVRNLFVESMFSFKAKDSVNGQMTFITEEEINHHTAMGSIQTITRRGPNPPFSDSAFVEIIMTEDGGPPKRWSEARSFITLAETDSSLIRLPIEDEQQYKTLIFSKIGQLMEHSDVPREVQLVLMDSSKPRDRNMNVRVFVPGHHDTEYVASFSGYQWPLVQKIIPQISFSVFLFALVCLSFILLYRSLRNEQRLVALKNNFVSNMTHELKTPISTIGVALEALQNFRALDDPKKTREYLDISKTELGRLSLLVDRVLKMSQFEKGEKGFKFIEVNLCEVVDEVLESMHLQIERQHATVHTDCDPETGLLRGDRVHLTNVIFNLLDNSLKYGGEETKIDIALKPIGPELELTIRDNGPGIPKEYQEKVFDRFFRVPEGNVHTVKGHGLGLSYVAEVVHSHKGTIHLESSREHGTTFTIKLPANESH